MGRVILHNITFISIQSSQTGAKRWERGRHCGSDTVGPSVEAEQLKAASLGRLGEL